jgi:hypothetical protein
MEHIMTALTLETITGKPDDYYKYVAATATAIERDGRKLVLSEGDVFRLYVAKDERGQSLCSTSSNLIVLPCGDAFNPTQSEADDLVYKNKVRRLD